MNKNTDCIDLLRKLVHAPTPSGNEEAAVAWVEWWLAQNGLSYRIVQGTVVVTAAPPDPEGLADAFGGKGRRRFSDFLFPFSGNYGIM